MFSTHRTKSVLTIVAVAMFAIVFMSTSGAIAQTTYTWTQYNNPTADASTVESWIVGANWDGNGVYVSGSSNELRFFANTTTALEQEGSLTITNVPAALSMNTLTLNGKGPNDPFGTTIIIGTNASTWTIGDGTTSTVNLNATLGGGGPANRDVRYTVAPNLTLNQTVTTFTGGVFTLAGYDFSGNITDGGSGFGITKSGNSVLVFSGDNTYSGTTTVNGGILRFSSATALPGGLGVSGGTSALTINGGVVELASGDFQRNLGTGSDQFQITGGTSGFSAQGAPRVITVNNDASQELVWGSANFSPSTLVLNAATATNDLILSNKIDLNAASRTVQVNTNTAVIAGDIQNSSGTAGLTKTGSGTLILSGTNTYNGPTTISSGTLSGGANNSLGNASANIVFDGGTLRINGTSLTSLSGLGHTVVINNNKTVGLDIADGANTFTVDQPLNQGNGQFIKGGAGTVVLNQANTYTGETKLSGGGTLVLDYGSGQDNAKISTNKLTSSGSEIILRGGTHTQTVSSTTLSDGGGTTAISRDGGTATINLNSIGRNTRQGASLAIAEDNIATTDKTNTGSGILGGWATVGSNWAKNNTNGADGAIVGLTPGEYTAFVTSGGVGTDNYQLTGSATLTGTFSGNTLRIANSANDDVLDLNTSDLRISRPNGEGGLLYAGGFNDSYTITDTGTGGDLAPQNGNQELIINTYTGTLNIEVPVLPGGSTSAPLSKNGAGTLVLKASNDYDGLTFVNQGILRLENATAAGDTTSGIIVQNGAAVELSNNITVGAEALTISGTGISNGGALRSLTGTTNTYGGEITIGAGGARINSDDTLTLTGGVVTAAGQDVTFGGAGNTTVSTSPISGAGNLMKDGLGTLILSDANTYTGATTVDAGRLLVNNTSGSGTGSGDVTVNLGGTLGGTGTIGGNVTGAGNIAPGLSAGAITIGGMFDMSGTYLWELASQTDDNTGTAGIDWDLVNAGSADLSALTLDLDFIMSATDPNSGDAFWTMDHTWLIVDSDMDITGNFLGITFDGGAGSDFDAGSFSTLIDGDQAFLQFAAAAVPEPASLAIWSLLGLSLVGYGVYRARRNK